MVLSHDAIFEVKFKTNKEILKIATHSLRTGIGGYDTQHNDKQHNDKHHNDKHHNDKHHNDKHHNDKQLNDNQLNEIQHNNK